LLDCEFIAPELYYEVFIKAYEKIFDEIPSIVKIEKTITINR